MQPISVPTNHPSPPVAPLSLSTGSSPTRSGEQAGGRPITEVVPNSRQTQNQRVISNSRVASETSCVPDHLQSPSKGSNRPLNQLSESPAPEVLQLGLRPRSLRSGRPDDQLGHDPGIRLSTDYSDSQNPGEA